MEKKYYEGLTQNRKNFVEQISYLITNELVEAEKLENYNSDELTNTLAIDSSFGMGKTYFSKGLTYYLKNEALKNSELENLEVINYNAWESDFFQDPMKTILYKILTTVDNGTKVEMELGKTGKKLLKKASKTVDGLIKVPIFEILSILKNTDKIDSLEDYEGYLNLIKNTKKVLEDKSIFLNKEYAPKVIIIDELDRCKPNFSIEVLEAVKHFFNIRGLFFVFLVNKDQLTKSAENLFGDFCGNESYFQKFFDLEFKLPKLDFQEYIEKEFRGHTKENNYLVEVEGAYEVDIKTFSEVLFLNFYKRFNCNSKGSVREFKKKLYKYRMLIKILNLEEKEDFTLLMSLTIYFIWKEYFNSISFSEFIRKMIEGKLKKDEKSWDSEVWKDINIEMFDSDVIGIQIDDWFCQLYLRLLENFEFSIEVRIDKFERRKIGLIKKEEEHEYFEKSVRIENNHISNLKYCCDNNFNILVSLKLQKRRKFDNKPLLDWCEKKYSFLEALYEHK